VGALYRELRQMEGEGLVDAVRTEQVGRRPARTIYAITQEGWLRRLTAKGHIDPFAAASMYRSRMPAETEVRWHDNFARILGELPCGDDAPGLAQVIADHAHADAPPTRRASNARRDIT
jgi:hypothetical protein